MQCFNNWTQVGFNKPQGAMVNMVVLIGGLALKILVAFHFVIVMGLKNSFVFDLSYCPGPIFRRANPNLGGDTDWYQEPSSLHARGPRKQEAAFQAPPSPDYVPGPEEPEQAPPSLYYVPEIRRRLNDSEDLRRILLTILHDGVDDGDDEMDIRGGIVDADMDFD
ncbi:hypothetical protein Tco_0642130 [Tanacetum coccineum]